MNAKLSITELKKLVEEIENLENREQYSDEVVFEFPTYTTPGVRDKKKIKVTLLPDEFGVEEKQFKIQNVDDHIEQFKERDKYDLVAGTPFEKIRSNILKELKQQNVSTKHLDIPGFLGLKKTEENSTWLFLYPNHYSKNMQQKITELFLEKFNPYIKNKRKR